MQGRYDLVFSDPPSHPSPPSTDTHDGQTEPATWNADTARTLFGVACAVAVFADAYHGGQSYIPAISAGLVLMLVPHWVLPTVRMKWVVGVALAGAVRLVSLVVSPSQMAHARKAGWATRAHRIEMIGRRG